MAHLYGQKVGAGFRLGTQPKLCSVEVGSFPLAGLPHSMVSVVLEKLAIDGTLKCHSVTKQQRRALVELCDVVVDGPYIEAERDLSLRCRGSRNQRIIDVARSLAGEVHLLEL